MRHFLPPSNPTGAHCRCFQRSKEMQMPQLTGYAHLALAQFALQHCLTDLPGRGVKRALPTTEGARL